MGSLLPMPTAPANRPATLTDSGNRGERCIADATGCDGARATGFAWARLAQEHGFGGGLGPN